MPPFSLPFVFLLVSMPTLLVATPKLDQTSPWDGTLIVVPAPMSRTLDVTDPWSGAASAHVTASPMDVERIDPWSTDIDL